jgi:catechol 2,3-dioxygenase-like lactoylglutathione lyase family enzyme
VTVLGRPRALATTVCFVVGDLEAEVAALRAAGVAIEREPSRTEYGMVEAEVSDPDGHRICFGQDL